MDAWVKLWCGWRGSIKFWRGSTKWRGWRGSKFWRRWRGSVSWRRSKFWHGSKKWLMSKYIFLMSLWFPCLAILSYSTEITMSYVDYQDRRKRGTGDRRGKLPLPSVFKDPQKCPFKLIFMFILFL